MILGIKCRTGPDDVSRTRMPFLLLALSPFVIFDNDYPLISCPLCKSKPHWNIFIIPCRNVEQGEMTCHVQEWQLCLSYFCCYLPLLYLTVIMHWFRVRYVNKNGKRKVQGVPQSQTAALPRHQRKRKPTNPNKHKSNKRTKSTKISSLFPKRGNRNTKRTEKHKDKMTHGKTYNKSPRGINHKATKSKTNTGTTAIERSYSKPPWGLKHFYSYLTSPWVPILHLIQKYIKIRFA